MFRQDIRSRPLLSRLLAWLAAVLTASLLGAMVQTQFNLAALAQLGASISLPTRLLTTVEDVLFFGSTYALLTAVALLLAFACAGLLARRWPQQGLLLFVLAGLVGIFVLLTAINLSLPMTPIAATRHAAAVPLMALGGAAAGWVFWRLHGRTARPQ